jgi:hypothetical protein
MSELFGFYPSLVRQGIFKGINLAALTKRFWALESMRAVGRCPKVRWHPRREWSSSGRAHVADRIITVSLGEFAAIEEAVELVLHEAVHCSCPPREMHGELFCRRLIACAREAFGLDLSTPYMLALPAQRGRIAYAIDEGIIAAMVSTGVAAKLRADPETRFEPAPPETEFDTIARQAALEAEREKAKAARVAARESHARGMLVQWERKLAAARKRAAKWRMKVRYYERRQEAAKRKS